MPRLLHLCPQVYPSPIPSTFLRWVWSSWRTSSDQTTRHRCPCFRSATRSWRSHVKNPYICYKCLYPVAKPWSSFSNFRCVPRLIHLASLSSKLYQSILFGTSEWKADFCVNPSARPSQQTQNKSSAFQFEDKQMWWDVSSLRYIDIKRYKNSILLHSHIVHTVPEYISCHVFIWQLWTCMFLSV